MIYFFMLVILLHEIHECSWLSLFIILWINDRPEFTPILHALITEKLGLGVECYENEDPCQKYNIIDESTGEKIGFTTFVEEMAKILVDDGICYFPRHELYSINHDSSSGVNTLQFSNGVIASVSDDVILNIPQRPLLKILRKSSLPYDIPEEEDVLDAIHSVQSGECFIFLIECCPLLFEKCLGLFLCSYFNFF